MSKTDNGYYRPFNYIKRDCKKCKKYLGEEKHISEHEYMRCELSPSIKTPYYPNGVLCARYEEQA
jgi:hypothetical protein